MAVLATAYTTGWHAFFRGVYFESNPYMYRTQGYEDWHCGWLDAEEDYSREDDWGW